MFNILTGWEKSISNNIAYPSTRNEGLWNLDLFDVFAKVNIDEVGHDTIQSANLFRDHTFDE